MIHGYHVIMPMYGFWLPNDPRGSWSDFVRRWEIAKFGASTKTLERRSLSELSQEELKTRDAARRALQYEPVSISGQQEVSIAKGFATHIVKSNYTVWACSILPEHTHLVIARHTYKVEQMVNLLKGASTRQITEDGLHPFQEITPEGDRLPRMWAAHEWKQYLDSEQAIEQAIEYVVQNPIREQKAAQQWSFVTPFAGINTAGWITYH